MTSKLDSLAGLFNKENFLALNEEMSFDKYLDEVYANPNIVRSAYQRCYDMIMEAGTRKIQEFRRTYTVYDFFALDREIPIFGLYSTIDQIVQFFKGAAGYYGTEKRVLLLLGPVGSSKSTICRRLKKGMEAYSRTNNGVMYTFKWVELPTDGDESIYT